jgi:cbb3-type cytochrome oxidase subunit 3
MVPVIACVVLIIIFLGMIAYSNHNKKQAHHP